MGFFGKVLITGIPRCCFSQRVLCSICSIDSSVTRATIVLTVRLPLLSRNAWHTTKKKGRLYDEKLQDLWQTHISGLQEHPLVQGIQFCSFSDEGDSASDPL